MGVIIVPFDNKLAHLHQLESTHKLEKEERLKKVTKHKANKHLLESPKMREERLQKNAKLKAPNVCNNQIDITAPLSNRTHTV